MLLNAVPAQFENVLAVVAHPGDADVFAGGLLTMAEHAFLILVTHGEGGGRPSERLEEQHAAAKILGVKGKNLPAQPDGFVIETPQLRSSLLMRICEVKPQLIVTHAPWDYCADHRAVAAMVGACVNLTNKPHLLNVQLGLPDKTCDIPVLWYFHSPLPMPFPHAERVLDVSPVMWQKKQAIHAHVSQRERYPDDVPLEQGRDWAKGTPFNYAERYYLSPYGANDNLDTRDSQDLEQIAQAAQQYREGDSDAALSG